MKNLSFAAFFSLASIAGAFSAPSFADERYVSDIIYIPLRADHENTASVIKNGIATGTRLKFIREEEDSNKNKWSQVITPDGMEGWVRSQNLISEPTSAMKLEALMSGPTDQVELQKQNAGLKTELASLKASYDSLKKETEEARSNNSSDINMEQENQNMHRAYQLLQTERDVLFAENEHLRKKDQYHQWLYGGVLTLFGVLLSFALQLIGKRKRRSEWN